MSDLLNCFPATNTDSRQTTIQQRDPPPPPLYFHNPTSRCLASRCLFACQASLIVSSATNKHISCCAFVYTPPSNKLPLRLFVCADAWGLAARIRSEGTQAFAACVRACGGEFDSLQVCIGNTCSHPHLEEHFTKCKLARVCVIQWRIVSGSGLFCACHYHVHAGSLYLV